MMPGMRVRPSPPMQHLTHNRNINAGAVSKTSTVRAMRVPKFLRSLYDILHYEDQTILSWSKDGTYFQIFDTKRLEIIVLPKYFKHGKFASFQRQLNNFGFRKWTKTQSSVCTFSHHHLVRCHPQQLAEFISRRPASVGSRSVTDAANAKRKRTFNELIRTSDAPGSASIKAIKREDNAYCRDLQVVGGNSAGKAGSSTSGPLEQAFNFCVDELHDIILPASTTSERQDSRSLEKMLELRILNECLDFTNSVSTLSSHPPGNELFAPSPYSWDSENYFAPVRAHVEEERGSWRLH